MAHHNPHCHMRTRTYLPTYFSTNKNFQSNITSPTFLYNGEPSAQSEPTSKIGHAVKSDQLVTSKKSQRLARGRTSTFSRHQTQQLKQANNRNNKYKPCASSFLVPPAERAPSPSPKPSPASTPSPPSSAAPTLCPLNPTSPSSPARP